MPLNKPLLTNALKGVFEDITKYKVVQSNFVKIENGQAVPDVDAYNEAIAEANTRAQALASELADALTNWIVQGTVTIPPGVIGTAGGPAAQTGPVAPVFLNNAIS